jgi:hypothetical protein
MRFFVKPSVGLIPGIGALYEKFDGGLILGMALGYPTPKLEAVIQYKA